MEKQQQLPLPVVAHVGPTFADLAREKEKTRVARFFAFFFYTCLILALIWHSHPQYAPWPFSAVFQVPPPCAHPAFPPNDGVINLPLDPVYPVDVIEPAVPTELPEPGFRQSFKALEGYCDHVPPIFDAERASRVVLAAKELNRLGMRAYITEPGPSMEYFTAVSWKLSERPFLLVIKPDQTYFYVSPKFEEGKAREYVGENDTIYTWEEDESPYELVYNVLGSPASGARIAFDPETRYFIQDGLDKAFGKFNSVENGLELVRNTRGLKSANEISILRCANEATKAALALVSKELYEGITEAETALMMGSALRTAGLTNVWHIVLFAENAAYPHGTENELLLKSGDLILIDTGGELHGYQSDITRTFPFEGYSDWQEDMWNTVRAAQQAALEAIRLGEPMGAIDKAARDVVTNAGYGSDYESFTHRLGHGIGLQGHEEIYAVRGNDFPITPGMCFSVEPGIYIMGKGGVRIEDIVCSTSTFPYYEMFGPTSDSIDDPFANHF